MFNIVLYIVLGLGAGVLSGLIGIGGGIVLVPAFVYLLHMSQHEAQGTTLALLLPPIGMLAVWTYYKHGYINWTVAGFACIGFLFGGLFGAKIATCLSTGTLRRIFGIALLLVGAYMLFAKPEKQNSRKCNEQQGKEPQVVAGKTDG